MDGLLRCVLSGAATGGRTFTGLAVLAATTPASSGAQPDRALRRPAVRGTIGVLAVAELGADKLPRAPSRLDGPGLVGRVVAAAACGVVVARRERRGGAGPVTDPRDLAAHVATATTAAVAAAWLGVRWRALAGRGPGPAWVGAVLEDAVVVSLAASAARSPA